MSIQTQKLSDENQSIGSKETFGSAIKLAFVRGSVTNFFTKSHTIFFGDTFGDRTSSQHTWLSDNKPVTSIEEHLGQLSSFTPARFCCDDSYLIGFDSRKDFCLALNYWQF